MRSTGDGAEEYQIEGWHASLQGERKSPSINPPVPAGPAVAREWWHVGWPAYLSFPRSQDLRPRQGSIACASRIACTKINREQTFHRAAPQGGSGMDTLVSVTCQQPAKLQCPAGESRPPQPPLPLPPAYGWGINHLAVQ